MAFDPSTARADSGGFDPSTARQADDSVRKEEKLGGIANLYGPTEALIAAATGMGGQVASGISGLAGTILPGPPGQGADWQQRIQNAVSYQPRTEAGSQVSNIISKPGELIEHGANYLGEKGTDITGSPAVGAGIKTAVEGLPMLLGARGGKPRVLTPAEEQAAKFRSQGFRITPSEGGGGLISKQAEKFAGEPQLSRLVSDANSDIALAKIGKELGVPEGTPLTANALADVETAAGKKYDALRKAGTITPDFIFLRDLAKAENNVNKIQQNFPGLWKELDLGKTSKIIKSLDVGAFDSSAAIEAMKEIRYKAKKAYMEGDPSHGKALNDASKALEDQMDRHLKANGDPAAVAEFRDARRQLAMVHDFESAVDKNGRFNPQRYASILRDSPGRLSGGALEVAEFAKANPRSSQIQATKNINNYIGPGDMIMGGIGGAGLEYGLHAATGGASIPAMIAARPALRAFFASKAGQAMLGSNLPPLTPELAKMLGASTYQPRLEEERGR